MSERANFAMIHTPDQWLRVAHEGTMFDQESGMVQLAWREAMHVDNEQGELQPWVGMAFDPWCRLYRSRPESGQVEKRLWDGDNVKGEAVELFSVEPRQAGDFFFNDELGPLHQPGALAVDAAGHLFIAEAGRSQLLVFDLVEQRLLRRVVLERPALDLVCDGRQLWVLLGGGGRGIVRMDVHATPDYQPLPPGIEQPSRIAISPDGGCYLLDAVGSEEARVVPLERADEWLAVPYASDILFTDNGSLVVARRAGEDFLRYQIKPGMQWQQPPLRALQYDGGGVVLMPDGNVGYWSTRGLRRATLGRVRYETKGRITGFRLDSGAFQTQWGRIFIDACIPEGTSVKVHSLVMDEPPEETEPWPRTAPLNAQMMTVSRPDLSPPMPPAQMVELVQIKQRLFKRQCGTEMPWLVDEEQHFATYEAPVIAPPGRYLWLLLELHGRSSSTPRIKSVRVEYPSHELMRRLPKLYSRDAVAADFMRRYLAMMEGSLRDLELRASHRHLLLNPHSAPKEVLGWLASLLGIVPDWRWPEAALRQLIAEGNWLHRYRGTLMGLKRFIEIYLGREITIIEHFKVRGLGGAMLGEGDAKAANSVLGAGFRIGGRIGEEGEVSVNEYTIVDAFATHAHRFSVIVPLSLGKEQRQVVESILATQRPAHTLYDICTVDAGMRLGRGLYAGLTSIVGSTSGFARLQLGDSTLGQNHILGMPHPGTYPGSSSLGRDSRVG